MKKLDTIDLKGKAYATVPTRIKEFRNENPNGLIETKPDIQADGTVIFSARILKDKANHSSGEATGHAIGKMNGDKAFEKLETISVGRALALLGYMASGEVASSEEMERFMEYQSQQKEEARLEAIQEAANAKTDAEFLTVYKKHSSLLSDPDVIAAFRAAKERLTPKTATFEKEAEKLTS